MPIVKYGRVFFHLSTDFRQTTTKRIGASFKKTDLLRLVFLFFSMFMCSVLIPSRPRCSVMNLYSYNLVLEGGEGGGDGGDLQ